MPTECSRDCSDYEAVEGRQVVAAFDGGQVTSDAGALLLGPRTGRSGWWTVRGLLRRRPQAGADRAQVETMLAQRVFGIALGYEDLVDHDELRHDPVLATLVGKLARTAPGLRAAGRQEHVEPARACAARRPTAITRSATSRGDRGPVRRPVPRGPPAAAASGSSSISMPPTIRCTAIRRAGSSTATTTATATCRCTCSAAGTCWRPSSGARTSTRRPGRSRRSSASSPRSARAGRRSRSCCAPISGFARDELMAWCEANGVDYLFGLARNARLVAAIEDALAAAEAEAGRHRPAGAPLQRLPVATHDSWSRERRVVAKAEHLAKGSNPRFVVTSLGAAEIDAPHPLRGRLLRPRRDGEPDQGAAARPVRRPHLGRDHARQPAPALVRLFAYVLLDALRRIGLRYTQFATATCGTIRLKLLKIGAQVRTSVRRIKVAMASACPFQPSTISPIST